MHSEYGGVGLEPVGINEDLEVGKRIHVALETFFNTESVEEAIKAVQAEPFIEPWQTWIEGTLYAWALRVWPEMSKHFRVVGVEKKLEFVREGVKFGCRVDLILESIDDHSLWVYDFKSFSWWDNKKWLKAVQLQIGVVALEETIEISGERPVSGSIIQGFGKGTVRKGQLIHPLVYGYRRPEEPGIVRAAYSYGYKRGFERFHTAGYPGGVKAWVEGAPDTIISDVLPQTPPIFYNRKLMDSFIAQRVIREREILVSANACVDGSRPDIMDTAFPQNFSACESDRRKCQMFDVCHNDLIGRDPVGSGLYQLRIRSDGEKPK